jgi:HK97 family phage major capsid protein
MNYTLNDEKVAQIAAEAVAKYKVEDAKKLVNRFTPGYDAGTTFDKGNFKTFGEYLGAINKNSKGEPDSRLKALSIGSPSGGGFTVPEGFRTELMMLAIDASVVRPRATHIPMTSDTIKIPMINDTDHTSSVYGGCVAQWKGEATALSETEPKFAQAVLSAKKLTGYTKLSAELLEDNAVSLGTVISMIFSKTLAFYEEAAFIGGDGAGKPLGILNSPALITVDAETGQGASTIVAENIFKMYARLLPGSTKNAVWLANPGVKPQLYSMGLAIGAAGSACYMPMGGLSAAPYDTLMGVPVLFSEHCPALGTAGDIILADLSYYVISDRSDLRVDVSQHIAFDTDEVVYRFVHRLDAMPWISAPQTPAHGSGTLSPFLCVNSIRT